MKDLREGPAVSAGGGVMSAHDKLDLARGWMFMEKLIADEDAARVEGLSRAELEQELRDAGYDPARVPTAEQLLAHAEARAAERARANEATEGARVLALAARKRTFRIAMLAAAMFALVVAVMAIKGPAIVEALFKHGTERIGPDNDWQLLRPSPPPQMRAENLRDEAVAACDGWLWVRCRNKLDEAQKLDPAGESEPRVQAARQQIEAGLHPDGGDKPRSK
jgi:hypothetical protein